MSEPIIIGVDHGYAAMKTTHFSFHTGLVAHEHEPYTLNNVLEYGGKYYVVGSGRQPLQKGLAGIRPIRSTVRLSAYVQAQRRKSAC